jgi:hypothetical protein
VKIGVQLGFGLQRSLGSGFEKIASVTLYVDHPCLGRAAAIIEGNASHQVVKFGGDPLKRRENRGSFHINSSEKNLPLYYNTD